MAKKKKSISRSPRSKKKKNRINDFFKNKQTHLVFGVFIFTSAIFLLISFYSFFIFWKEDQSQLENFANKDEGAKNILGKLGASISDFLIFDGFGIATFIFPILLFFTGLYIILDIPVKNLRKSWINGLSFMIWFSIACAYYVTENNLIAGKIGFEINEFLQIYIGRTGVLLLLNF